MKEWIRRTQQVFVQLHREDAGQDLIEYALIAALIALGAVVGMGFVASAINNAFNAIGSKLSNAVG